MQWWKSRAALLLRHAAISTLVQQGEWALEESTSPCRAGSSPMQPCVVRLPVKQCLSRCCCSLHHAGGVTG